MVETQQEGASLLKMFFICVALQEINIFSFEVLFVIWKHSSNKIKIFQLNILIKKLHFTNMTHWIQKVKVKVYHWRLQVKKTTYRHTI